MFEPGKWPISPRVSDRAQWLDHPFLLATGIWAHAMGSITIGLGFFRCPRLVTNEHFNFVITLKSVNYVSLVQCAQMYFFQCFK